MARNNPPLETTPAAGATVGEEASPSKAGPRGSGCVGRAVESGMVGKIGERPCVAMRWKVLDAFLQNAYGQRDAGLRDRYLADGRGCPQARPGARGGEIRHRAR